MIVELNLTQIIVLLISLGGAMAAAAKLFYRMFERAQDARFKVLTGVLEKNQDATLKLERDLLQFQADIPRTYLRRDDYMREAQALREAIRAEITPIRVSVNRIEDFLIQK